MSSRRRQRRWMFNIIEKSNAEVRHEWDKRIKLKVDSFDVFHCESRQGMKQADLLTQNKFFLRPFFLFCLGLIGSALARSLVSCRSLFFPPDIARIFESLVNPSMTNGNSWATFRPPQIASWGWRDKRFTSKCGSLFYCFLRVSFAREKAAGSTGC